VIARQRLDELLTLVGADEAAPILGIESKRLRARISELEATQPNCWHWQKGVVWFQYGSKSPVLFNSHMLKIWFIAWSVGDAGIYTRAVEEYCEEICR
jgi:hypothetical protein